MNYQQKTLLILILFSSFMLFTFAKAQEGLGPSEISSIAFSPDGSQLAVASGPNSCSEDNLQPFAIRIIDVQSNQVAHSLVRHQCIVNTVSWSPDGSKLASSGEDGLAFTWDVNSAQVVASVENSAIGLPRRGITWDVSNNAVADFIVTDPRTFIWDAASGGVIAEIEGTNGNRIGAIAWSPDGTKIAVSNQSSQLQLWNAANIFNTGQASLLSSFEDIAVISLAWGPNSNLLAYSTANNIAIFNTTTQSIVQTFVGHTQPVLSIAWSPHGNSLISGSLDNTVRIWNVATGLELSQIQTSSRVRTVAWSPNGIQVAYGGADDTLEIVTAPGTGIPTPTVMPSYTPTPLPTSTITVSAGNVSGLISAINSANSEGLIVNIVARELRPIMRSMPL